jgi:hypothetical protein
VTPGDVQVRPNDVAAEQAVLGALLLSKDAVGLVGDLRSEHFYRPAHAVVHATIMALHAAGEPVDPITVTAVLQRAGRLQLVGGAGYLHTLVECVPTAANADHYAAIVQECALRREAIEASHRALESLYRAEAPAAELVESAVEDLRSDDEPEWVLPGLLARWDRLILTGGEGAGKSLLTRQMVVRAASGLHPWLRERIEPQRALLVDAENSAGQVRPWLRKMAAAAAAEGGEGAASRLAVEIVEGGMDLQRPADRSRLLRQVEASRPDLIVIGPLYKVASGNPNEEGPARTVMSALESVRSASNGAALVVEAHAPHQQAGARQRDLRPLGSSLWLRWPEFGFALRPAGDRKGAALGLADWVPWRGGRCGPGAERTWPAQFLHGTTWPWAAAVPR